MKTRFVLIHTSHAGNVGAAARAMKTMGFDDLVLVAPRWPDVLQREETLQRSSGALDVLARARVVETLDEALDGMTHLCATAMTPRDFGPPTRSPREHLPALAAGTAHAGAGGADGAPADDAAPEDGVAFLFGSERFGMRNEDVYRCDVALRIPTDPAFGSLNLGAAIQVVAYEWRTALGGFDAPAGVVGIRDDGVRSPDAGPRRADARELAGMLGHWESALADIGFLDPQAPKKLMPRLRQLFGRARPTQEEIHILRGIAKAMSLTAKPPRP